MDVFCQKGGRKAYQLQMTASVQQPWSIYSGNTLQGGPVPTTFDFAANPLAQFEGAIKEQVTLKKKFEEVFRINVLIYNDKVTFMQRVKLKGNAKTRISSTLEYMACSGVQCFPPTDVPFSIPLQ